MCCLFGFVAVVPGTIVIHVILIVIRRVRQGLWNNMNRSGLKCVCAREEKCGDEREHRDRR